jgi:hypothetical protein
MTDETEMPAEQPVVTNDPVVQTPTGKLRWSVIRANGWEVKALQQEVQTSEGLVWLTVPEVDIG